MKSTFAHSVRVFPLPQSLVRIAFIDNHEEIVNQIVIPEKTFNEMVLDYLNRKGLLQKKKEETRPASNPNSSRGGLDIEVTDDDDRLVPRYNSLDTY